LDNRLLGMTASTDIPILDDIGHATEYVVFHLTAHPGMMSRTSPSHIVVPT